MLCSQIKCLLLQSLWLIALLFTAINAFPLRISRTAQRTKYLFLSGLSKKLQAGHCHIKQEKGLNAITAVKVYHPQGYGRIKNEQKTFMTMCEPYRIFRKLLQVYPSINHGFYYVWWFIEKCVLVLWFIIIIWVAAPFSFFLLTFSLSLSLCCAGLAAARSSDRFSSSFLPVLNGPRV